MSGNEDEELIAAYRDSLSSEGTGEFASGPVPGGADPAVRLPASYTGLQESGVPTVLHSWTAGGEKYEVYQTVTAMEDQVL